MSVETPVSMYIVYHEGEDGGNWPWPSYICLRSNGAPMTVACVEHATHLEKDEAETLIRTSLPDDWKYGLVDEVTKKFRQDM